MMDAGSPKLRPRRQCNLKNVEAPKEEVKPIPKKAVRTSAKATRGKVPTTDTVKKAKNNVVEAVEDKPVVASVPDKLPTTGLAEPKRIPVYKQVVAAPSFVEDLENDVYEIRPQDLVSLIVYISNIMNILDNLLIDNL
jgi:hypothetical protein